MKGFISIEAWHSFPPQHMEEHENFIINIDKIVYLKPTQFSVHVSKDIYFHFPQNPKIEIHGSIIVIDVKCGQDPVFLYSLDPPLVMKYLITKAQNDVV